MRKPKRLQRSSVEKYTNYMLWIHLGHNLDTIPDEDQPAPFRVVGESIFKLSESGAYQYHCSISERSELIAVCEQVSTYLGV